ncbi:MAG: hypothetical protein Q9221_002700 [Calogaya cf. arnoldii]
MFTHLSGPGSQLDATIAATNSVDLFQNIGYKFLTCLYANAGIRNFLCLYFHDISKCSRTNNSYSLQVEKIKISNKTSVRYGVGPRPENVSGTGLHHLPEMTHQERRLVRSLWEMAQGASVLGVNKTSPCCPSSGDEEEDDA